MNPPLFVSQRNIRIIRTRWWRMRSWRTTAQARTLVRKLGTRRAWSWRRAACWWARCCSSCCGEATTPATYENVVYPMRRNPFFCDYPTFNWFLERRARHTRAYLGRPSIVVRYARSMVAPTREIAEKREKTESTREREKDEDEEREKERHERKETRTTHERQRHINYT